MTKLDFTKAVVSTIVGIGTASIVTSICSNNTNPDTVPSKVAVGSATVVVGWIAADVTKQYTDAKIDELANWWKENIHG